MIKESAEETTTPVPTRTDDFTQVVREPVLSDEWNTGARNLKDIFNQIRLLWQQDVDESEDDNDEFVPPTAYALERMVHVLEQMGYEIMKRKNEMPKGNMTSDFKGGIRIEWWRDENCVILSIGAREDSKSYAFIKLDEGPGKLNNRVLPVRLANQLITLGQTS